MTLIEINNKISPVALTDSLCNNCKIADFSAKIALYNTNLAALEGVESFNKYIQEKPWLDIDFVECNHGILILHGGIDLTQKPDTEIRFNSVFFVSSFMTWRTDTSQPVLRLMDGEKAIKINQSYRIEQGNYLFTFCPEDFPSDTQCVIAAKSFSWQIL